MVSAEYKELYEVVPLGQQAGVEAYALFLKGDYHRLLGDIEYLSFSFSLSKGKLYLPEGALLAEGEASKLAFELWSPCDMHIFHVNEQQQGFREPLGSVSPSDCWLVHFRMAEESAL